MKTMYWLLRREMWENRSVLIWIPALTGLLGLITAVIATATMGAQMTNTMREKGIVLNPQVIPDKAEKVAYSMWDLLHTVLPKLMGAGTVNAAIYTSSIALLLMQYFYCLRSLHEDRTNGSSLLWKSLPISDTQTVLSKLIFVDAMRTHYLHCLQFCIFLDCLACRNFSCKIFFC